jgi:hypothetical protein
MNESYKECGGKRPLERPRCKWKVKGKAIPVTGHEGP